MKDENTLQLGEKIFLTGFNEIDNASMIILKKLIGNYAKQVEFEKLEISLSGKYNITAKIDSKTYKNSDKNIFMALDGAFKKIK